MCRDSCALGCVKGFYCKITGSVRTNAKYPMPANFSMLQLDNDIRNVTQYMWIHAKYGAT